MNDRCEFCQGPAQWRFTEVVGGRRHSVPVCADCARDRGIAGPHAAPAVVEPPPAPASMVSISFELATPAQIPTLPTAARRCTQCGTTLVAIRKSGRVGCPACYLAFRQHLEPLLRRVHGSLEHRGHRPDAAAAGSGEVQRRALDELRADLRRAVESEDFENAARLRDAIAQWRTPARKDRT